ncbi:MAG: hypothetical protein WC385_03105 [Candidatus Paceibacterota bacterium]|jgi:hypothetical protein
MAQRAEYSYEVVFAPESGQGKIHSVTVTLTAEELNRMALDRAIQIAQERCPEWATRDDIQVSATLKL